MHPAHKAPLAHGRLTRVEDADPLVEETTEIAAAYTADAEEASSSAAVVGFGDAHAWQREAVIDSRSHRIRAHKERRK